MAAIGTALNNGLSELGLRTLSLTTSGKPSILWVQMVLECLLPQIMVEIGLRQIRVTNNYILDLDVREETLYAVNGVNVSCRPIKVAVGQKRVTACQTLPMLKLLKLTA
jgi:hypothetical protein